MAGTFGERKALSPAIAAVILIGVVVAVSIAVSLWMSSLSVSLMRIDEVKIVSHTWASDLSYVDLTVKNAGTEAASISTVEVNNVPANVTYLSGKQTLEAGESSTVRVTQSFVPGMNYEFWIATETGQKFVYLAAAPASGVSQVSWWNTDYALRKNITVTNNMASTLPAGYTVSVSLNTSNLIASGKMLPSGNDLRIVYRNGSSFTELDRDVVGINSDSTKVLFRTQEPISANSADKSYELYYDNAAAVNPPDNKSNVYLWFDDFNRANKPDITVESAYSVKTGGGTWSVENDMLKNVGASGDPNKLIITALGNLSAPVEMLAKIRVSAFSGGDVSRMGLSCCMDSASPRGSGYCALFHQDSSSLDFLNDLRSWGTKSSFSWSLNSWYYMRFRVVDPASRAGQVRVWPIGVAEPSAWTVDGNFGGGAARSFGEVGLAGSRTSDITFFDDVTIRYSAVLEPSVSLGMEENLFP